MTDRNLQEEWFFYLNETRKVSAPLAMEIKWVVDTAHTIRTGLACSFGREPSDDLILGLTRLALRRVDISLEESE
jgi:hypothetical protein